MTIPPTPPAMTDAEVAEPGQPLITDEMIALAADIESAIGLRNISLLGVVATAYLAGWRDAMNQANQPELSLPPHMRPQPMREESDR